MNIQDINGDGVALDGIDPVTKLEDNPERGKSHISFSIGKTTYYFANEENLEKFKNNPEDYLRGPNELATTDMVENTQATDANEQKHRWDEKVKGIKKNSFASNREPEPTSVQHDGYKLKGKDNR